jgi:hypothetical protein
MRLTVTLLTVLPLLPPTNQYPKCRRQGTNLEEDVKDASGGMGRFFESILDVGGNASVVIHVVIYRYRYCCNSLCYCLLLLLSGK